MPEGGEKMSAADCAFRQVSKRLLSYRRLRSPSRSRLRTAAAPSEKDYQSAAFSEHWPNRLRRRKGETATANACGGKNEGCLFKKNTIYRRDFESAGSGDM